MVNNETRYLQITGLVRKQDISRLNTITYDKIAEARIFYGGQGQITNVVRPRIGNKVLSKILPF
jgi:flagellar L-ring protein precursor FlgH